VLNSINFGQKNMAESFEVKNVPFLGSNFLDSQILGSKTYHFLGQNFHNVCNLATIGEDICFYHIFFIELYIDFDFVQNPICNAFHVFKV
jgi:hypothetical protein